MPEKFYSVEEANALVPKLKPLLERIRATQEALAKDKSVTPSQLALAWVMSRGEDVVPIPGTKRRSFLEQNAKAADVTLMRGDLGGVGRQGGQEVVGGEVLDGKMMLRGRLLHARDEPAAGRAETQAGALGQQVPAGALLQVVPALVGAADQRHVVGVLVVREPDDPRQTARRSERVAARKALESEHGRTTLREMKSGAAAVRAEARDDDVRVHAGKS